MRVKLFFVAIFSLLLGVVIVQNTEVVTIRFLIWTISMSRIVLLLVACFMGFVLGYAASKVSHTSGKLKH